MFILVAVLSMIAYAIGWYVGIPKLAREKQLTGLSSPAFFLIPMAASALTHLLLIKEVGWSLLIWVPVSLLMGYVIEHPAWRMKTPADMDAMAFAMAEAKKKRLEEGNFMVQYLADDANRELDGAYNYVWTTEKGGEMQNKAASIGDEGLVFSDLYFNRQKGPSIASMNLGIAMMTSKTTTLKLPWTDVKKAGYVVIKGVKYLTIFYYNSRETRYEWFAIIFQNDDERQLYADRLKKYGVPVEEKAVMIGMSNLTSGSGKLQG